MNEKIQRLEASAFKVPTDFPESDGTAEWDSTTLILVELGAGKFSGLGYSYAHESCLPLIRETLFPIVRGKNPFSISTLWNEMNIGVRNFGRHGIASSAISTVEIALWDLKAKILNLPLVKLLGPVRDKIPVYGSGGLNFLREHAPAGIEIAAGEYNYDVWQAQKMLVARAVDVLQADATRCGVTGFLQMATLCDAFQIPLSAHTAPALHAHLCCAANRAEHVEYFYDHVRIEQMFFDGATTKHKSGFLQPDFSQPGLGLELKKKNAEKFRIKI